MQTREEPRIMDCAVSTYVVPTDGPESDGTLEWEATTIVLVEVRAKDLQGIGYTYASRSSATVIEEKLKAIVTGKNPLDVPGIWRSMVHSVRNLGQAGACASAIAAVDTALWDLKAKLLGVPLVKLLGQVRDGISVYGSGGFTSYTIPQLQKQLSGWASSGIGKVKMKIGREPQKDPERVKAARVAIGPEVELFVDANGAYDRKLAISQARKFAEQNVVWFEEPVSSDDLEGLRLVRDRAPDGMEITAGEYGYTLPYFRRMIEAGAVDVIQPDATRCCGITGFMQVDALCCAYNFPFSAHTSPSVHLHPCCAALRARHLEYFHDHARIEKMFFEGAAIPRDGVLKPDLSQTGLGLIFKKADAEKYRVA
jgi:L-alanine-DL-glutamate epimerase-like enolase superfamily enzyme